MKEEPRDETLNLSDICFAIESLNYTIKAFNEYQHHPSYNFKKQRVKEAEGVRQKFRDFRDSLKKKEVIKNESPNQGLKTESI